MKKKAEKGKSTEEGDFNRSRVSVPRFPNICYSDKGQPLNRLRFTFPVPSLDNAKIMDRESTEMNLNYEQTIPYFFRMLQIRLHFILKANIQVIDRGGGIFLNILKFH